MNKLSPLFLLVLVFSVGCGGGGNKSADAGSGSGSGSGSGDGSGSGSGSGTGTGDGAYSILYPYAVETGRISYNLTVDQQVTSSSGTSSIITTGVETLIFSNWGNTRRMESTTHTDAIFMVDGKTTRTSFDNHSLSKVINKLHYMVDFERQEIEVFNFSEFVNPLNIISNDVLDNGEENIYKTGGVEYIDSYECKTLTIIKDVNIAVKAGDSVCDYKRVNLRTTIDRVITGDGATGTNKSKLIASNVEFNIALDDDEMALPDFTVINGAQLSGDPHVASELFVIDVRAVPVQCSDGAGTLVVSNDVINGTVSLDRTGQSFDVSGQIGPDKKIHGGFVENSARVADYNGEWSRIGGLSGTWEDFDGCYGTWSSR